MVKLCVVEIDFWTSMLIGRDFMMKNEKPEIPIAKATGIPKIRNTKKINIAVAMIYFFPHSETGVFIEAMRFIAVFMNIRKAPAGTHDVTQAYEMFSVVIILRE